MTRPNDIPQGVWDVASRIYPCHPNDGFGYSLRSDIARAIIAEREACAVDGRSAVMKFRAKVGGRYYPGYHEDMRDAVANAIRSRP